tara:strand:- start:87 stop:944 length:858 start_codon:yes stop_codon:yes gene_type:complete
MTETAGFLTVEQAVARLINFDYIPEGFTLLDMTASFLEDAEGTYESAQNDGLASEELELIACWANSCEARHQLAESLMESLQKGIEHSEPDLKLTTDKSTGQTLVSLGSLNEWAAFRFGIQVPDIGDHSTTPVEVAWDKVKIKIYAGHKIGFWLGKEKRRSSSFQDIGLMGSRKNVPNNLGGLLLGLSKKIKYPKSKTPAASDKTAICKLRGCLKKLTGLTEDPFTPYNEADGWKPRFTLIDDRGNADERAKERTVHDSYNDELDYGPCDFQDEDDDAGNYLKGR